MIASDPDLECAGVDAGFSLQRGDEGLNAVRDEGRDAGIAESILALLAKRGLEVPPAVAERFSSCRDLEQLKTRVRAAAGYTTPPGYSTEARPAPRQQSRLPAGIFAAMPSVVVRSYVLLLTAEPS
ncbi:MAG TPA: hypothetical protein VES73_07775 [Lamprocystis sp. (in: g-proteobacteria)]|nr:hypothetical protein [Lamprocystis sp. (in: g-proteobacteria)]